MGATGSVQSNEMNSDPSLSPHSLPQQSSSDGLPEDYRDTVTNMETEHKEVTAIGEELWLKQIQDLGKIIQNLASENLKLIDSNKELNKKCEQQESIMNNTKFCEKEKKEEFDENLQMITNLQEEAASDKKLIEDLKQQLQTNTENSAIEVEKYHENLNFMRMKVKEYEQVVEKLEKNAAVQNDAIQSLQSTLSSVDCQGNSIEESTSEMKVTIETLKQNHKVCQQEKKALEEKLEEERNLRRKISDEKERLHEEFVQIKQAMRLQIVKRNSENSDADGSDLDVNGETDQPACASSSRSEEARALSPRAAAELEVFQKQLKVKREARHKALSAISMEMERLRRELNNEREVRHKAVKELEDARNVSDPHHLFEEVNALRHKLTSEQQEKDRIYKEMVKIQKEGNEEVENVLKQLEKEKKTSEHVMEEIKYFKAQLEECDQMLQVRSEENTQLQNKLETDRQKFQQQVLALKEVVAISKQMLTVRENQVAHLKQTLQDVETSVIQKHRGSLTAELRAEYQTQMENIKALKALYEERMQVMNVEKEKLVGEQKELQRLIEEEKISVENLETKLQEKEDIILERNATVSDLQDQLSDAIDQSRNLSYELTLINNMFTQILGSSEMDLDRLTKLLQENHDLITEITTKGDSESEITASLPKLLLDLVSRAENIENAGDKECSGQNSDNASSSASVNTEQNEASAPLVSVNTNASPLAMQDISSNLPKVWKVLLELVSHHVPSPSEETSDDSKTSCYKRVDTPNGPKNVISVSKTFLRLRDLILQKKSLQKEVTRLKQLNVHLETKLNDQERRLSLVSSELRKTWNVVDHMRVQHQQLHTHEKVLRYELQEKRKLLMELKEELEYCREKWEDARQKNSQSETEWQKLRQEFALRKNKPLNNSGESGFSEEKDDDNSDNDATKMQTQRKSSNSEFSNSQKRDSTESVTKLDDPQAVNNSSSSLPDLVAVTADLSLPPSSAAASISAIPTSEMIGSNNDSIPLLQNIVQDTFSLENVSNGPPILEPSLLEECPTVSLITLLKQQLSCFSKNLEIITTGFDTNDHFRALQSIFALPAIQIPENLNPLEESRTSYLNKARASIDRGIQVTEECRDEVNEPEVSVCEKDSPHFSERNELSQTQEKLVTSPVESSSSSSSISLPCSSVGLENAPKAEYPREASSLESTEAHSNSENVNKESRSERLQRMERQCQQLFDKVTRRSETGSFTSVEPKDQNKSQENTDGPSRSFEDMLDARAARLKRLEEQSQQLFKKVTRTTHRSTELSNRLEELHEQYGSEDNGTATVDNIAQNMPSDSSLREILEPLPTNDSNQPATDTSEDGATSLPGPSVSHVPPPSLEDKLDARAARLKRLEEQSQQLFTKVTRTTHRSTELSNRLEELHEQHGSEDRNARVNSNVQSDLNSSPLSKISEPPPILNIRKSPTLPMTDVSEDNATSLPGPSISSDIPPPSLGDRLDARAARLKRLEEQPQQKVTRTTHRSTELSNRHGELREQCTNEEAEENAVLSLPEGNCSLSCDIPVPPPFPDHLLQANSQVLMRPVKTEQVQQTETPCSTSSSSSHIPSPPSLEGMLDARAARLKRLEEQSQQLFKKVKRTTHRSTELSNRLEQLHDQYGSEDSTASVTHPSVNSIPLPPPLPDHLVAMRLPTTCLPSPSSSHIPLPPPLPNTLPSEPLPEVMDQPGSSNNEEQEVCNEEKEQR